MQINKQVTFMKKFLTLLLLVVAGTATAQNTETKAKEAEGYVFTDTKIIPHTPVKDQHRSGTCWCFSTLSYLENELLKAGYPEIHLSEMWITRHSFMDKAVKYVRLQGKLNFAEGGASHDVIQGIEDHGIVPFEAYPGLNYGTDKPDFHELSNVLKAYLDAVIDSSRGASRTLSTAWKRGFNAILDEYFGEMPETFTYNGKEWTPKEFAQSLPIKMSDYVDITSFTHHPFYSKFIIELPDNWMWSEVYNVPMEEMVEIVDHALAEGYSVAWGTDVSEKGFSRSKCIGIIPEADIDGMSGTESARWGQLTEREKEAMLYKFDKPGKERTITQEMRQIAFDNYETTDDHGMVIMGLAKDQAGNEYYKVQNSWNTDTVYKGFWYFSRPFFAYKTTSITINRNAVPKHIQKKLGWR